MKIINITLSIVIGIFLFPHAANAQVNKTRTVGIGVVAATNPYQYEVIERPADIFLEQNLEKVWQGDLVSPFFYKPDYGLYHFVCLDKSENYFKILVNDTEIAYLPADTNYKFLKWEELILGAQVERIDKSNKLRISPHLASQSIHLDCERESFLVTDFMQKDGLYWMEVTYLETCGEIPREAREGKKAWLQWRNEDDLLVIISLLC